MVCLPRRAACLLQSEFDLGYVDRVVIYNRADCCQARITCWQLQLLDELQAPLYTFSFGSAATTYIFRDPVNDAATQNQCSMSPPPPTNPLPANTPLGITTSSGSYVRTDNTSGAAYPGSGDGSTKPEQFVAQDPANPNSVMPILPGNTTVLKSSLTGLYCRLGAVGTGSEQGMICDQPTPATATQFTYSGTGLSVGGVPMVSSGPGAPLVLANTTTSAVISSSGSLSFPPAGPDLAPGTPFTMQTSSPTAGYVRTDTPTTTAYVGTGDGTSAAEQFTVSSPTSPGSAIQPGTTAILRNEATGMYCRLAPLPGPTPVQTGMLCGQPTAATATPLLFTGSGLASSDGVPLVATSAGMVLANTTSTPPGPDADNLVFQRAPQTLAPLSSVVLADSTSSINPGSGSGSSGCLISSSYPRTPLYTSNSSSQPCSQFMAINPSNSLLPVAPNSPVILFDNATNSYCRVVDMGASPLGSGSASSPAPTRSTTRRNSTRNPPASSPPPPRRGRLTGSQQPSASTACSSSSLVMVCDQASMAGATQLTFTGTQLQYNGQTLSSSSPGAAAVFCPTPSSDPINVVPGEAICT